jgi:hypothetical protein
MLLAELAPRRQLLFLFQELTRLLILVSSSISSILSQQAIQFQAQLLSLASVVMLGWFTIDCTYLALRVLKPILVYSITVFNDDVLQFPNVALIFFSSPSVLHMQCNRHCPRYGEFGMFHVCISHIVQVGKTKSSSTFGGKYPSHDHAGSATDVFPSWQNIETFMSIPTPNREALSSLMIGWS